MNGLRAHRAADQLAAILARERLPPRVRAMASAMQARLSAPVRLAVLGRPGSGKAEVINGLLGGPVLPLRRDMPPAEVAFGLQTGLRITDAEGRDAWLPEEEFSRRDPRDIAFVRVETPLPLLEQITILSAPLEGTGQSLTAALDWVTRRADMLLWCLGGDDTAERRLWRRVPERLMDHAFLAVSGPVPERAELPFRAVLDLGGAAAPDRVRSVLLGHVARARREDLEGALLVLDQYQPRPRVSRPPGSPAVCAARQSQSGGSAASPTAAFRGDTPEPGVRAAGPSDAPADPAQASAPVAEALVATLLEGAARLADLVARDAAASDLLAACAGTIEACATRADAAPGPLADLVDEASELMLLLQLEASDGAAADGLALLAQLRRECCATA